DIDVDFEHHRREEVIQYVYTRYGRSHAALTAVVITYRHRSALRDTGKALGITASQIEDAARRLRRVRDPAVIRATLSAVSPEQGSTWATLIEALVGFPRHLSQHPGGFVIARQRLDELVPLENAAMPGRSVIQWDKDDLDTMGLLKVDILALGMLTVLRDCATLVGQRLGHDWSLVDIPKDDPGTFGMIQQADTVGVFQIESRAQMSMLPRLRPQSFYDLVIQVAIVRPGPMQGGMVHPYLRRRQGLEAEDYPSPEVRAVLKRTLGIPIFQEQAMRLAMVAAGFSAGEADQLRRAMAAWRRTGEIASFHERLRSGMARKGYTAAFAEGLILQLEGFGEYGFPESHAASFARLAWASAWLKHHEPEAFLAALLNAQPMGFYAPSQLVQDARRHGVVVLPVDVRHSADGACLENNPGKPRPAVRLGLSQIQGLSQAARQAIIDCRGQASITSIQDLSIRARLDARDMRALAAANAFANLSEHRRQGHWQATLPRPPGLLRAAEIIEGSSPQLPPPTEGESLVADYAALGLTLGRHPLCLLREQLTQRGFRTAAELVGHYPDRRLSRACGLVTTRQRPHTANGTVFVTLEDETGPLNVIVHAREAEQQHSILVGAALMGVYGIWQRHQGVCHLIGRRLVDLSPLLGALSTRSRDFQ
ncbi:MAG TPA: error-prone DNA polymerase, partial [Castellaniella sp.]|nr:error-prone DNA polymerase [Castellaniella sp.]